MDNTDSKIKVVDLFCGCGGLSKGLELAGFKIVAAFDCNPEALQCYSQNFSHAAINQDLSFINESVKKIQKYHPDIIVGGPPCQDFSLAGKRIEGSRAELTICFSKIIQQIKPTYFIMENVANAQKSDAYIKARSLFIKAGYKLNEEVLDASFFEVPQKRKRFVVVGHLDAKNNHFLTNYLKIQASDKPITVKEMFPNFPVKFYYRHPRTYERRAVFSIEESAPTIRGVNRPRPENYVPHQNDKSKSNKIRALTYKERAQIQTFPSSYIWPDLNKTNLEQMIGNAVPVNFSKKIGLSLQHYINDIHIK